MGDRPYTKQEEMLHEEFFQALAPNIWKYLESGGDFVGALPSDMYWDHAPIYQPYYWRPFGPGRKHPFKSRADVDEYIISHLRTVITAAETALAVAHARSIRKSYLFSAIWTQRDEQWLKLLLYWMSLRSEEPERKRSPLRKPEPNPWNSGEHLELMQRAIQLQDVLKADAKILKQSKRPITPQHLEVRRQIYSDLFRAWVLEQTPIVDSEQQSKEVPVTRINDSVLPHAEEELSQIERSGQQKKQDRIIAVRDAVEKAEDIFEPPSGTAGLVYRFVAIIAVFGGLLYFGYYVWYWQTVTLWVVGGIGAYSLLTIYEDKDEPQAPSMLNPVHWLFVVIGTAIKLSGIALLVVVILVGVLVIGLVARLIEVIG